MHCAYTVHDIYIHSYTHAHAPTKHAFIHTNICINFQQGSKGSSSTMMSDQVCSATKDLLDEITELRQQITALEDMVSSVRICVFVCTHVYVWHRTPAANISSKRWGESQAIFVYVYAGLIDQHQTCMHVCIMEVLQQIAALEDITSCNSYICGSASYVCVCVCVFIRGESNENSYENLTKTRAGWCWKIWGQRN
jgi:hypothetical protein